MVFTFALLLFFLFNVVSSVRSALFVIEPLENTVCHGGSQCTVQWVDDGNAPLLSSIAGCTVALYTGVQQVVQQLVPVDVARTHSFVFTPNPAAGPNSNAYYIGFTSIKQKNSSDQFFFQGFSPAFTLKNMRGNFASPDPSATSSVPVPPKVANPHPNTVVSTTTIGVPSPPVFPSPAHSPSPSPAYTTSSSSSSSSQSPAYSATTPNPQSSTPTPSLPAPSSVPTAQSPAIPVCSTPRTSVIISLLVLSSLALLS